MPIPTPSFAAAILVPSTQVWFFRNATSRAWYVEPWFGFSSIKNG
jgi:hypothetical protein